MACCTNTYDLGCHSQCDLLELTDLQWPSSGDFCFYFTFAGNTYTWTAEDQVSGYNVELSMQYLNEDGETTFYIKDSNGNILTFDIDGTEYDCFKIQAIPAGCGTTDFTTTPTTCTSAIGVNCQIPYWSYDEQEWERLDPGTNGQVLGIVGGCVAWIDQSGGGGSATWGSIGGTLTNQADLVAALATKVPTTRAINTMAPLAGGGNLSADRTLTLTLGNLLQVVSNALALGGTASGPATLTMGDFKFLLQSIVNANQTVALEKNKVGNEHYAGGYADNTESNLKAYVNANGHDTTGELQAEVAMQDTVDNTLTGINATSNGVEGYTRGDLLITVNTVVGTFQISETVTADNGATGVIHSVSLPTKKRILPVSGDWLTVSDITGNTSGATANVSNVVPQKWSFADHNGNFWFIYDEYEGYILIGHDSADRPNVGVLIQNEVYLLDYPETRDDTGTIPQTNVLYTGPNGEVCSAPFSGGNTIYTADDSLTGDRIVDGDGNDLAFDNVGKFDVQATHNHVTEDAVTIEGNNNAGGADIHLRAFGGGGIKATGMSVEPDYDTKLTLKNNLITPTKTDKQFIVSLSAGANNIGASEYGNFNHFKCPTSGAAVSVFIDSASMPTLELTFKDISGNASVNNITISSLNGTDTFDGQLNIALAADYASVTIVYNGDGTYSVKHYYEP